MVDHSCLWSSAEKQGRLDQLLITVPILGIADGPPRIDVEGAGQVESTARQFYAPYGTTCYANGTLPTDYGFTGQRADSTTGLDYYGARYYDPALGQFTSADTVADGLNRYGYVKGNPETLTDPTGHMLNCEVGCGAAVTTPPPPPSTKEPVKKTSCGGIILSGNCWTQGGGGTYDMYSNRVGFEQSGHWIAAQAMVPNHDGIYLIDVDHPDQTIDVLDAVKTQEIMEDPVWSPDGKTLIVVSPKYNQPYAINVADYLHSKGLSV